MKIKKAFDICKKRGLMYIYQNTDEEQWLSDGSAMYPICGLPLLTEENVCRLYDITDAQRDKIAFNFIAGNPPLNVADNLKRQGVRAGVPDLCLPVSRGKFHALYIEMKVGKNKPTKNQKDWMRKLNEQGNLAIVCYGWEEASAVLMKYIKLKSDETVL